MISFVIPTLNEEKSLEDTLACLSGYSGDKEIIISDGGSTDRTLEIARKFTDKVLVNTTSHRQTIAQGRNAGAFLAKGEYIICMDADVTIPYINEFLREASAQFEKDRSLFGLTVAYRVLPELETYADWLMFGMANTAHMILNNLLHIGGAGGEFQMVRREQFLNIGGYNEKLASSEDQDLFWRLNKIGRTVFYGKLHIYHTGRRAHKIGCPKLFYQWVTSFLTAYFLHKSAFKEWVEVR